MTLGDSAAFFTILFFTCVPCTMEYAVQIRMYSLAIFCVTLCGVSAYIAFAENRIRDWIMFTAGAVGAAYLHYFAFVAVCFEIGLLFIALVYRKIRLHTGDNGIKRWIISVISMIVLYIPWLPIFYEQVTRVREDYWIPPIEVHTVWEYFTWAFDSEIIPGFVYCYLFQFYDFYY